MVKPISSKMVTITDSDGNEHTIRCSVYRTRKAPGSNTFGRTAKVRGKGAARTRNGRKTEIRTRNVASFGGPIRTEWNN